MKEAETIKALFIKRYGDSCTVWHPILGDINASSIKQDLIQFKEYTVQIYLTKFIPLKISAVIKE